MGYQLTHDDSVLALHCRAGLEAQVYLVFFLTLLLSPPLSAFMLTLQTIRTRTLSVSAWVGVVVTVAIALLAWYGYLRQRPSTLSFSADRAAGTMRLRRGYWIFAVNDSARLDSFSGVDRRPFGDVPSSATAWLQMGDRDWPLLPRFASGASGDGFAAADEIAAWIENARR